MLGTRDHQVRGLLPIVLFSQQHPEATFPYFIRDASRYFSFTTSLLILHKKRVKSTLSGRLLKLHRLVLLSLL